MNAESALHTARRTRFSVYLAEQQGRLEDDFSPVVEGLLKRVVGTTLEAVGVDAPIGSYCQVQAADGDWLEAEVVGFSGEAVLLMPTGDMRGVMPDARVVPISKGSNVPVGDGLLGRVLDGSGKPLDLGPAVSGDSERPLVAPPINPLQRQPIRMPLDVGVRCINAMLTVGRGQRLGLFAGSGVGKSTLLGMMTRFTNADIIVVALIGERGREVKEFVDVTLGPDTMQRAVVVATPADHPPLMRLRGAWMATSIAEYFRDRGHNVLLLMDSLTRFAQAQREIALAIGEPPATKGYPPSVFARLPQLVERAGNGADGGGSITAFYTVLAEGDDQNDPIVDAARAILDGHIVLSRKLAESGQFPAIDIEQSVSRAINDITTDEHRSWVKRLREAYSTYQQNKDLITIGAYQQGTDARVDEAIRLWPAIQAFLCQGLEEHVNCEQAVEQLRAVFEVTPDLHRGERY